MSRQPERRDDRWLTPGVVMVGLVVLGLVVVAVAVLVALMVDRGLDPSPVLQLATTTAAALGSLGGIVLQLYGRRTATRTERHAGTAAAELSRANSTTALPASRADAGAVPSEQTWAGLPPVPPSRPRGPRHGWPAEWANGNGPDAAGEARNRAR